MSINTVRPEKLSARKDIASSPPIYFPVLDAESLAHVLPDQRASVRREVVVRVELPTLDDSVEIGCSCMGAIDGGAAGLLVELGLGKSLPHRSPAFEVVLHESLGKSARFLYVAAVVSSFSLGQSVRFL